jgi:hypothetical protein
MLNRSLAGLDCVGTLSPFGVQVKVDWMPAVLAGTGWYATSVDRGDSGVIHAGQKRWDVPQHKAMVESQ